MSNTDIKLPTSGSLNWGGGLNRYLENLNLEVANLQRLVAQKKEDYHLVGYAGSGMVGECDIEYSANSHKVSFSGSVYLSGEYAYYKENLEVESSELSETPYPVFVFLKADIVTSGEHQGEYTWSIETNDLFQIDYHYILLGVFYRSSNSKVESFIPYYFSSAKTLAQHRHELIQRWADLNKNLTSLTVTIKDKIPSILSTDLDWTGDFDLYCGGLGHSNEQTTLLNPTGSYTVSRKHTVVKNGVDVSENKDIDIILFQDGVEEEFGPIITSKILSWNSGDFNSDKSVYFRILLDIFGNIIIQKSLDDSILYSEKRQWSEQQLYNARFASIESSVVSGDSSHSWEAGLPIEVARFGYNCKDIENITYIQNDHTPGLTNFNFVKSLDAGVAYQQAQNIYLTQDSEIWTDKVSFKKNSLDLNSFTIDYLAKTEYYITFKNELSHEIEEESQESTMECTYFIGEESCSKTYWLTALSFYVTAVDFYTNPTEGYQIIKSFKTKNVLDKITLWGIYSTEKTLSGTIKDLYDQQDDSGKDFIKLYETEDPVLGISITKNDDTTYSVTLGVYDSSYGFVTDNGFVMEKLWKQDCYFSIMPYNQDQIVYFDFTSALRAPSKVLWCQTNLSESIYLASDGISLKSTNGISLESTNDDISLTSTNDISLTSTNDISLSSTNVSLTSANVSLTSANVSLTSANADLTPTSNIGLSSTNGISLESTNGISLSSLTDIVVTTDKKFLLTTSDNPSDEDAFRIALRNNIPLNITTSSLSLSNNLHVENNLYVKNDLYVKNELNLGTEGFITSSSDKRLKTDIKDINYSFLDIVNRTPVLSFKYKGGKDIFVGLMAQDLQNNLPEEFKNVFVKTHETDQYKDQLCLTETKLVYMLWKALQEEVKNNEKLKEEVCEIKKYLKL